MPNAGWLFWRLGHLGEEEHVVVQRHGWVEHEVETIGVEAWSGGREQRARRQRRPPPCRRVADVRGLVVLVEEEAVAVVPDA
jgi:hypothetical protein